MLLEAASDYFSYQPVLKALQQTSEATLPFFNLLKLSPTERVGPSAPAAAHAHTLVIEPVLYCIDAVVSG